MCCAWYADAAKALGYAKPQNAIDAHCRYALKRGIPHPIPTYFKILERGEFKMPTIVCEDCGAKTVFAIAR